MARTRLVPLHCMQQEFCITHSVIVLSFHSLHDNQITDEGARVLGEALRVNQSLTTLE